MAKILIISGALRSLQKNLENIYINLIEPNSIDKVFIDTWDNDGSIGANHKLGFHNLIFRFLIKLGVNEYKAQDIVNKFGMVKPKYSSCKIDETLIKDTFGQCDLYINFEKLIYEMPYTLNGYTLNNQIISEIEHKKNKKYTNSITNFGFNNMLPMFYKIQKSAHWVISEINPSDDDILIRLRPDLFFEETVHINENTNKLVVFSSHEKPLTNRVPDQFFYGKKNVFLNSCDVFSCLNQIIFNLLNQNSKIIHLGGEHIFSHHLRNKNIIFCQKSLNYFIDRKN